ncbi:MAG: helix-turn-helix transcriptional regulator [Spirochaetes bacterium]|nr:helix-turn-helix transcriptional regulator [Spirochaetota bacterium]
MIDELGKIIRFHRKKSGLSQLELANMAGVGKTVVFDMEKGKETVKLSTIKKILDVLNITISFNSQLMKLYREAPRVTGRNAKPFPAVTLEK